MLCLRDINDIYISVLKIIVINLILQGKRRNNDIDIITNYSINIGK